MREAGKDMRWIGRHARGGQAIVEYLLVASAIIAAVVAIRGTLRTRMDTLLDTAVKEIPYDIDLATATVKSGP